MKQTARTIAVEVVVIVGSILLAFAIDAAWDTRQEAERELRLREAIAQDLQSTDAWVGERIARYTTVTDEATSLLRAWNDGFPEMNRDSALARVGSIFLLARWAPVNTAYEEAVASGTLSLIDDADLRRALTAYAEELDFGAMLANAIETQYYTALEPWMVRNTVYGEVASDNSADLLVSASPFQTDFDALVGDRELWNLLTLKLEIDLVFLGALHQIRTAIDDLSPRVLPP